MPPKKAEEPAKKKKELPKELCGCSFDTYRPPPKGKKKQAPIEHAPGCVFQRAVCSAYPHLPKCAVCINPCKYCAGTNRWCPHCYENRCTNIFNRVVHGQDVRDPNGQVMTFAVVDGNATVTSAVVAVSSTLK